MVKGTATIAESAVASESTMWDVYVALIIGNRWPG